MNDGGLDLWTVPAGSSSAAKQAATGKKDHARKNNAAKIFVVCCPIVFRSIFILYDFKRRKPRKGFCAESVSRLLCPLHSILPKSGTVKISPE